MNPPESTGDPTIRRKSAAHEIFGLAVRRVEIVHGTEPAQRRLTTVNPNYAPVICLAEQARIVATVLWMFRRPKQSQPRWPAVAYNSFPHTLGYFRH